ncbi:DsbA family protein [Patescibacteria group bacterium]|nr:DsbA family protein [Patescibacteria group bacterium]MDE1946433.1 DsbA family protein [Patescibacteria group bacterium]MDE2011042.1 DsbA family protein [Patescibacteria group bacterium]MDE2233632.1 DsbA family protein [Patescibacteria group bacterium]
MNTKRILFWTIFVLIIGLIIWGLAIAMKKPLPTATVTAPAPISATDHVKGPSNAPVTLIEYSDFECPACEQYYPVVTQLLSDEAGKIQFVYRHFPLPQHTNAVPAAMASEAAAAQGKFWDMYDLLFTNHADWVDLSDPTSVFVGYATKLGLNVDQFKTDLASSTLRDRINADLQEGTQIGIDATPTFFVNGKAITNPSSYDQFKSIIDAAASSTAR